jgi:lipopolysaccharide export system permease protein
MHALPRYVLIELTKVFVIVLVALAMMMIIVGVIQEGTRQNLPLAQLLNLIPYILPDALRYTLPVSILLATTTVYARMAGFNEVVAIKALGISPLAILWPTFIMAFLLSLVTVYLNDVAVSWGRHGAQRVVSEAVEQIAYNMLRAQHAYSTSRFAIYVKRVEGRRLISTRLSLEPVGKTPAIMVTAEEAELRSDPANNVLKIFLRNGTVRAEGKVSYEFPDVDEREIPLRDPREQAEATLPSWMPLSAIPEQIARHQEQIRQHKQEMAVRAALDLVRGDFGQLQSPEWAYWNEVINGMQSHLYRLLTEPHRRWSAGFSCLFFVWVGAPMAIRLRNGDLLTSFFLCFLPILIVYYPLLVYGIDGSKHGTIPPYSVWAGNLMLFLWGTWLLRKVMRY